MSPNDQYMQTQEPRANDRLKNPVSVALTGFVMSSLFLALRLAKSGAEDFSGPVLGAFALVSFSLCCLYAFLGWRYSVNLAKKVVGSIALLILIPGVLYLIWIIRAMTRATNF